MPRDRFGREINYLRISLTDHCNLRCIYCMPVRDLRLAHSQELLSAAEIATVVRVAVGAGFRKFRLTGGEPTLRSDLLEIVQRLSATPGVEDLSMTTNGVLLPELAPALRRAGLKRVNLHLDTLNPEMLPRLMRFGKFEQLWAGLEAAVAAGFSPIKINCVVTMDYNDADVAELAALTLKHDWQVRFIELMPLGESECARAALAHYVPTAVTRERIEAALGPLAPLPVEDAADEARRYRLPDAKGVVGFISPVSEPYCESCNRMRLTADGRFHLCLLNDDELDVKAVLRNGGGDEAVADVLARAVALKPTGHHLDQGISVRRRQMYQIGG